MIITGRLPEGSSPDFIAGQALATGPLAGFLGRITKNEVSVDLSKVAAAIDMPVDDIRIVVTSLLKSAGYEVVSA